MIKPKTVCLVHFSSWPGGAEVLIPEIISGFPEREFISFVIRPDATDSVSVYSGINQKVLFGSRSNLLAGLKLFRFARSEKNAIFHVWGIGPFFLFVLRIAGVKNLIYSIHGTVYWKNLKQKYLRKIAWWLAIKRKSYLFTSNSEFSKKVFWDKIDPHANIKTIYNPINTDKFYPDNKVSNEPVTIKKIIFAGRLTGGKGLEKWINVAVEIHRENRDIKFEIFGEGGLRSVLSDLITQLHADNFIFLMGHMSDMGEVYRSSDLVLFLSEYESFGNVVAESILCGTPVIAADIPSMKEIFVNYPDFLVPSEGNHTENVPLKLKDYNNLKKKCNQARSEFESRFSSKQHIEKLSHLYAEFNS